MCLIVVKRVVEVLIQIFFRYGFLFLFKFDNGFQFCCVEFEKFFFDYGIEYLIFLLFWLQVNGYVERQNRILFKILKVVYVEGKNWCEEL